MSPVEKTSKQKLQKQKQTLKETKQAQEEQEIRYIHKPNLVTDELIAEQIWDRKNSPKYIVKHFNQNKFYLKSLLNLGHVDSKGRKIINVPVDNDSLRKGLVIVPTTVKKATFKEVLQRADAFMLKCYDPLEQVAMAKLLVRVCLGSWFLDRFVEDPMFDIAGAGKYAPIIPIRGGSTTGKNRYAFALRLMSYRPYFEMSTYRVPSLYRPLDLWQGTLVLDEADFAKTTEKSEVIHFLNCRATGTPISRQNPQTPRETDAFTNFGITILTQRRHFDDNATESRCLPYYSEKTEKKLPTVETDEMLKEGLEIQNMMLYLRMKYYTQVKIDKTAWFENITDPRLTASLLPLLAIAKFESTVKSEILDTVKSIEKLKVKLKSNSEDGVLINYLWNKIEENTPQVWNYPHFYILEDILTKTEDNDSPIPLTTSVIAEKLQWTSRNTRKILNSLNLCSPDLPSRIKVGKKSWRAIFFKPEKLEKQLREFVFDYEPNKLFEILGYKTEIAVEVDDND